MESGGAGRFGEHDDRDSNSRRGRGGRWTRGGSRGRGRRGSGVNPRSRLQATEDDDGDTNMDDMYSRSGQRGRYRPYNNRSKFDKSPPMDGEEKSVFKRLGGQSSSGGSIFTRLSGIGGASKFTDRGESWHKISILKGGTQSKEWLIKKLQQSIKEPFQAVQVHLKGDRLMFFVSENGAAHQLKRLRQIESRDGPLQVLVKPCPPPKLNRRSDTEDSGTSDSRNSFGGRRGGRIVRGGASRGTGRDGDEVMEEDPSLVVKQVLGQRYDPSTKSLNLSDMFHDSTFHENGVRASMFDREFVSTILGLIGEHCSELLSLNLSNNRLQFLQVYTDLPLKCPNLRFLDLSENQLRSPAELEHIAGLKNLHTLVLDGNPLSQHSQDFASFSSKLRKLFPSLQLLDGQELPSPVKFDIPVAIGQLPQPEKSYLVNDGVKSLVVAFLEQYYTMYDSDSREKLLEAYSNDAVLSLCVSTPPGGSGSGSGSGQREPSLREYFPLSRNLVRVADSGKRFSLLKRGRIDIVQFLRDLPRTKHHSGKFAVDVIRATPLSTSFVVYGIFTEVDGSRAVRAFTRTFLLTAAGNGVAIVNDQLTIRNAVPKDVKYAREEMSKLEPQSSGFAQIQPPSVQQNVVVPIQPSLAIPQSAGLSTSSLQDDILHKFSAKTKMNHEWCRKCLTENNWDLNKAEMVFSLLQSQGRIPQEAFFP